MYEYPLGAVNMLKYTPPLALNKIWESSNKSNRKNCCRWILELKNLDTLIKTISDDHRPIWANTYPPRVEKCCPIHSEIGYLAKVGAGGWKGLDTIVIPVHHQDVVLTIDGHTRWCVKLTTTVAMATKRLQQFPICVKHQYAVMDAICDDELVFGIHRCIPWTAELGFFQGRVFKRYDVCSVLLEQLNPFIAIVTNGNGTIATGCYASRERQLPCLVAFASKRWYEFTCKKLQVHS